MDRVSRYWRRLLEKAGIRPERHKASTVTHFSAMTFDRRGTEDLTGESDIRTLVIHPDQAQRLRHDPAFLPVDSYRDRWVTHPVVENEVGRYQPRSRRSGPDGYLYRILAPKQIGRRVSPVSA